MKHILIIATTFVSLCMGMSSYAQTEPPKVPNIMEINRKKIDSLDQKLIEMIGTREKLVKEIGEYKAANHIPPLQASRFQEVLNRATAAGKTQGLSEDFIKELLNAIHKESLRIENEIKGKAK